MIKISNVADYPLTSKDIFFFDANIWIFLYGPISNSKRSKQQQYSKFFKEVISTRACIWINSLVLSEFSNAFIRIEFEKWRRLPENVFKKSYKKDYVPSQSYKDVISEIRYTLKQIVSQTERTSDNFNAVDLERIYLELENCDFNDSYYLELARLNNWKIVTDDADLFRNNRLNVEILTANI
jgi:predicted nucleic acid-binding protein